MPREATGHSPIYYCERQMLQNQLLREVRMCQSSNQCQQEEADVCLLLNADGEGHQAVMICSEDTDIYSFNVWYSTKGAPY